WASRSPLLEGRQRHPIDLAEMIDQPRRIGLRIVGLHEIVGAGENIIDAGPARVNDKCSVDSVARPHGTEQECLLDMISVAPPCTDCDQRWLEPEIWQTRSLPRRGHVRDPSRQRESETQSNSRRACSRDVLKLRN